MTDKEFAEAIIRNGGATLSVWGLATPDHGYMVGGMVPEVVVSGERFVSEHVSAFIDEHFITLATESDHYVGGWHNPETGNVHLDVARWYADRERASITARERGEIAIFDLATAEAIVL